ncbi:hypothetical protein LCGC14_0993080 [marine sediment metagenome]|uniref:RecA family profile 1 domain-containing protein n=1 Tax=marine sediment metagenome TaxID=412755 RepID=A0A0F9N5A0_9ZZZZ
MPIEVKPTGAGFSIAWPEHGILGQFRRLREEKGQLKGHISLWRKVGEQRLDLYDDTFNVDSARSRAGAIRVLSAFGEDGWQPDWPILIESIRKRIQDQYRQGSPMVMLAGDPDDYPVDLRYVVKPLLFEGEPTIVFAEGGSGKGWVSVYLSMLIAEGVGSCDLKVDSPGNVLYLDWEQSEGEINRRVHLLKQGGLAPDAVIAYRRCSKSLADDIEDIADMVQGLPASAIIIDSLLGACGGEDLEKSQTASRFFLAYRTLKVAAWIITHTSKDTSRQKSAFGSGYWSYQARSVWQAVPTIEPGADAFSVGLVHTKVNMGRLQKPMAFKFSFYREDENGEDTSVEVMSDDPASIEGVIRRVGVRQQIIKLLQEGPLPVADILDAFPKSKQAEIRNRLSELKKGGVIVLLPDRTWALASDREE